MSKLATIEDKLRIENEALWSERDNPATLYEFLGRTVEKHGTSPAVSFQLLSDPKSSAKTLTWRQLNARVTQAANMLRSLGVDERNPVAFLLPNANETVVTLLAGAVAGVVNPINPLLDADQVAAILRASNARVLVALKSFPKSNVAQLASTALENAPNVKHLLEVDLNRYLTPPKSWIVPFVRPKNEARHSAKVQDFNALADRQPSDELKFEDIREDRVAALFHTGGTTGMPKLAQHQYSGIIYNGWCGAQVVLNSRENILCPLPLFHVFAAHPILMSCIASGSHVVLPTPQGYRGEGVFDNFWKLIERWKISFLTTVPTAAAALMQRPIDADVSSLHTALCGSAPLPVELFNRFEKATGVKILEGYGLTEATCLVSVNPLDGERKVGSVGIPAPYTQVRILECEDDGSVVRECRTGEVGEICVSSPGVLPGRTYVDSEKNVGLYADSEWLRTGDLGKVDEDGYVWITGRAKDLIIRGGHNIDPAIIEEALASHEGIAFVGAIGQPESKLGEIPCAYVELVAGSSVSTEELMGFAQKRIESAIAKPVHIEILDELPKTAVGKVFKPDLRKRAIKRVFNERLASERLSASVVEVVEDPSRGLVAMVGKSGEAEEGKLSEVLGEYIVPWVWSANS